MESESKHRVSAVRTGGLIEVDDMYFHQCVKLANFANDSVVSFTPPDGEFELMRYRKIENIGVPFTITSALNSQYIYYDPRKIINLIHQANRLRVDFNQ